MVLICIFLMASDIEQLSFPPPPQWISIFYLFIKNFFSFLKKICLFIFWLHWVFVAVCGLSLVAASRGYSSLWCTAFSLRWLLLLRSTGSRHVGFSSYDVRTSVVVARRCAGFQ